MPIYEYACRKCGAAFEMLVRKGKTPACTACASEDLERLLSLPSVKSDSSHAVAMRSAKKRDQKTALDRVEAQRLYEKNHD